ncbi:hypothetical protein EC50959_2830 [Escherichia coli 5.0959]|nr:hypothetical protein EC50959_2830 [Escherichia coli 5.0959]
MIYVFCKKARRFQLRAEFSLDAGFVFYLKNASLHVACSSIKDVCADFFAFERNCQRFSL